MQEAAAARRRLEELQPVQEELAEEEMVVLGLLAQLVLLVWVEEEAEAIQELLLAVPAVQALLS
jgi:hypothetical protein